MVKSGGLVNPLMILTLQLRALLDLTKSCMKLNVNIDDAELLLAELSLHSAKNNIKLETDKWG
jgi:hypothetical protein